MRRWDLIKGIATTFLAVTAFAPSAFAQGSSIPYGQGAGSSAKFQRFHQDRDEFAKTGQPFKIEGHCQSACTLFLKLRNVCIDPNAELLFHAGGSPHSTEVMLDFLTFVFLQHSSPSQTR
jgi:hypothetical protein